MSMNHSIQGKTMWVGLVDDVLFVIHSKVPPATQEWSSYCELAGQIRRKGGGHLRTLVLTTDAAPNASQRAEYKAKVAGKGNRVAVLCHGGMARAVLTAMAWFNPDMKAFASHEIDEGLKYLGATRSSAIEGYLDEACYEMGLSKNRHSA